MVDHKPRRVRFVDLEIEPVAATNCRAQVALEWLGARHVATAEGTRAGDGDAQCGAEAAVRALADIVAARDAGVELLDLEIVPVLGSRAAIVALSVSQAHTTSYAVGFCMVKTDVADAAVRAVLNGTNRFIQQLWYSGSSGGVA